MVNENIYIFDVSYDNHALMMQTTPCVIPYSYYIFDNKSFQLDIHSYSKALKELCNKISEHVINKVKKFNAGILNNKMFIDYLKEVRQEPKSEYRIRLRNINVNNVTIFNNQNNIIEVSTLQTFDRVVCLFQLQRLVVQKDTYYFQASVVQIKKLNTPLVVARECLIIQKTGLMDDEWVEEPHDCKECKLSIFDKIEKVVENKMQISQQQQLFEQIKKGISLRDTTPHQETTKPKHVSFQPSLSDILHARNKLKPVL